MSSLEEQLKSVRLKTVTAPKRDYSDPKLAGFTSQQEVFNYQKAVLQCNIENWYEIIKNCTFKTAFCEILNSEAKIFVQIYKRIFANKDASELSLIDWNYKLTDEEKITIKSLESRLENSLTEFVKNDGFAFVKTSSRSAKDAPLASSQFKALYSQYTAEKQQEEDTIENFQITCLLKAAFECLRIKNAEQVIEMFIKSERIYQDMLLALDHPEKFNENFVIREFVDIDVDMEFRGFVFNGKLNALSQYNFLIYSKRLNENKNEILKLISDFYYTEVSPLLLKSGFISNYVIDFAVFSMKKVMVIELNPFLETTDGALFSWQHEKSILEDSKEIVFRITERCKPGAKSMLPQSIKDLMKAVNLKQFDGIQDSKAPI